MKKLVASILVVALMLTLGSAFAEKVYAMKPWDGTWDGIMDHLDDDEYYSLIDGIGVFRTQLKDGEICLIDKFKSSIGVEVFNNVTYGGLNSDTKDNLISYLINIGAKYCLYLVEIFNEPTIASTAEVAKEVSKDGKVTIYAAPSKSSTKLASAVSYYDCQILGTADVDGATWTKVNYVKEDVEGWILTK